MPEVAQDNTGVARVFDMLEKKFWLPDKPLSCSTAIELFESVDLTTLHIIHVSYIYTCTRSHMYEILRYLLWDFLWCEVLLPSSQGCILGHRQRGRLLGRESAALS